MTTTPGYPTSTPGLHRCAARKFLVGVVRWRCHIYAYPSLKTQYTSNNFIYLLLYMTDMQHAHETHPAGTGIAPKPRQAPLKRQKQHFPIFQVIFVHIIFNFLYIPGLQALSIRQSLKHKGKAPLCRSVIPVLAISCSATGSA